MSRARRHRALRALKLRRRKRLRNWILTYLLYEEFCLPKCRYWMQDIYVRRQSYGEYHHLFSDMRQDEEKFIQYFRLSWDQFDKLFEMVGPRLRKTSNRPSISARERLAATLRHLASGMDQKTLAESFRFSSKSAHRIILETCTTIWDVLRDRYLPFPDSPEQWKKIAEQFWEKWQMPHCLGAMDGKHVEIRAPPKTGSTFYNYKDYFSIILFAVADANYCYVFADIGATGSRGDANVFSTSTFGRLLKEGKMWLPAAYPLPNMDMEFTPFFVGDAAFPLQMNLMRPFPGAGQRVLPRKEAVFNYRLSRARRIVENTFGITAARWRVLMSPILAGVEMATTITRAVVVLHNFCRITDMESGRDTYLWKGGVDLELQDGSFVPGDWRTLQGRYSGLGGGPLCCSQQTQQSHLGCP